MYGGRRIARPSGPPGLTDPVRPRHVRRGRFLVSDSRLPRRDACLADGRQPRLPSSSFPRWRSRSAEVGRLRRRRRHAGKLGGVRPLRAHLPDRRSDHQADLGHGHGQLAHRAAVAGAVRFARAAPHGRARPQARAGLARAAPTDRWASRAKEEQYGTWRGWRRGHSHIDLIAPRVRTPRRHDGRLQPRHRRARTWCYEPIILPHFADSTEFVKWLPQAKGKLRAGERAAGHLPARPTTGRRTRRPKWPRTMDSGAPGAAREWGGAQRPRHRLQPGPRRRRAGRAPRRRRRGRDHHVASQERVGHARDLRDLQQKTPAITLSCEDYGLVFRLTENDQHPKLRLNLDGKLLGRAARVQRGGAPSRAPRMPNEYVVLSAHFDSWDGSSGATDNGTGTITMLEAMRILKQVLSASRSAPSSSATGAGKRRARSGPRRSARIIPRS